MDKSFFVKVIGFPATLIHEDPLIFDRWLWLKTRLPRIVNNDNPTKLVDIGCGLGAFIIGAAFRGYKSLGLTWDERDRNVAEERAGLCKASFAAFEAVDVRYLDARDDFIGKHDVAICFECIEHIINDIKLIRDIVTCLKPGGRLLLTTPNYYYRAITAGDNGPFSKVEDGRHVRRGYTKTMLMELCEHAGLICESISFCSGFLSQKITFLLRVLSRVNPLFSWGITLPLRILPPILDRTIMNLIHWPYYSICVEAYKQKHISFQDDDRLSNGFVDLS